MNVIVYSKMCYSCTIVLPLRVSYIMGLLRIHASIGKDYIKVSGALLYLCGKQTNHSVFWIVLLFNEVSQIEVRIVLNNVFY